MDPDDMAIIEIFQVKNLSRSSIECEHGKELYVHRKP